MTLIQLFQLEMKTKEKMGREQMEALYHPLAQEERLPLEVDVLAPQLNAVLKLLVQRIPPQIQLGPGPMDRNNAQQLLFATMGIVLDQAMVFLAHAAVDLRRIVITTVQILTSALHILATAVRSLVASTLREGSVARRFLEQVEMMVRSFPPLVPEARLQQEALAQERQLSADPK
jgi:hypothetical protein